MNIAPCSEDWLNDELFEFVTAVADGQMSFEQIEPWIKTHLVEI
jgi:hypothetical protein